jgi:hypothetical protein
MISRRPDKKKRATSSKRHRTKAPMIKRQDTVQKSRHLSDELIVPPLKG